MADAGIPIRYGFVGGFVGVLDFDLSAFSMDVTAVSLPALVRHTSLTFSPGVTVLSAVRALASTGSVV
jgi:hypothetical protein